MVLGQSARHRLPSNRCAKYSLSRPRTCWPGASCCSACSSSAKRWGSSCTARGPVSAAAAGLLSLGHVAIGASASKARLRCRDWGSAKGLSPRFLSCRGPLQTRLRREGGVNQEWRFQGTRAEEPQVLRPFHGKPTGQEDAQRCPERSEHSEALETRHTGL